MSTPLPSLKDDSYAAFLSYYFCITRLHVLFIYITTIAYRDHTLLQNQCLTSLQLKRLCCPSFHIIYYCYLLSQVFQNHFHNYNSIFIHHVSYMETAYPNSLRGHLLPLHLDLRNSSCNAQSSWGYDPANYYSVSIKTSFSLESSLKLSYRWLLS